MMIGWFGSRNVCFHLNVLLNQFTVTVGIGRQSDLLRDANLSLAIEFTLNVGRLVRWYGLDSLRLQT